MPVYAGYTTGGGAAGARRKEEPSYMGTFTGARRYVLQTFANDESALMKRRVAQYMVSTECPAVPRQAAAARSAVGEVRRARHRGDVAPAAEAAGASLSAVRDGKAPALREAAAEHPEKARSRAASRGSARACRSLLDLGPRLPHARASTPTLSPGELQRLRLGDAGALQSIRRGVRAGRAVGRPAPRGHRSAARRWTAEGAGNSLFVVEHELDVIRHADWIVDVGPAAGEHGGECSTADRRRDLPSQRIRTRHVLVRRSPPRATASRVPHGVGCDCPA